MAVVVGRDGSDRRVATLYAGDFFGEMALFSADRRTATVRSVTDAQLYELRKPEVDRLCEASAGVRDALVTAAAARKAALERPSRATRASRMMSVDDVMTALGEEG